MSMEIRQMIDRVKNYKQFIKEEYDEGENEHQGMWLHGGTGNFIGGGFLYVTDELKEAWHYARLKGGNVYKLKDEYSLHWSRYIYNQYLKGSTGLRTRTTRTFRENRDYFNCRQDTNKYKSTFSIGKTKEIVMTTDYDVSTENTNRESSYEGWANINFEPVSAMYKLANMIHGTYDDADWELVANCTDQQSGAEKEKFKWMGYIYRWWY